MIANRIANASQVRFRSDSHPNRPTRPDPSRPISVVAEVFGSLNNSQIQSHRYLGSAAARIGFGEIR